MKESLKISDKAIDDLKITMKQFMTNTQRIATIDDASRKTSDNEIAFLKSQIFTMKSIQDRLIFVENIRRYQNVLEEKYSTETHIPGKIMTKLVEFGVIRREKYLSYLRGDTSHSSKGGNYGNWESWTTHATEEELLEVITALLRLKEKYIFYFPIVICPIYNNSDGYIPKKRKLKETTYAWFLNFPSNVENLPGKCKTFAEGYFTRVDNVLTKLHKMGLLK